MNLDKEVGRLSTESGLTVEEVKKGIDKLVKDGYDDVAALAIWKSENSMKLGGTTLKGSLFRVVGKEKARDVKDEKKGTTTKVSGFGAFVVDGTKVKFASFSAWGDNTKKVEQLELGKLYSGDIKLKGEGEDGIQRATLLTDAIPATPEEDKKVPQAKDLLASYGADSISKAVDHIGKNGFFSGIIGKVFGKDDVHGIELSDVGGNPVGVFVDENDSYKVGERVIVYGYVSSGKKGISVRASGVFVQ